MRRSRFNPEPTSGIVDINEHDAHASFEPLARYGFLPTSRLVALDDRHPQGSRDRLTDLASETAEWKLADKPIIRLTDEMRSRGIGAPAFSKNGPAAAQ